jgi:hypothetical protein
MYTSQY